MKCSKHNLCPCGSNVAYKNCCFVTPNPNAAEKLQSIEKLSDKIINKINTFCNKHIDRSVLEVAWQPFVCWSEFSFEQDAYDIPESGRMFNVYQLFHWQHLEPFHPDKNHSNPARYYLSRRPMGIDERDFIQSLINSHYCFYQIIKVVENHHLLLKNLFTDQEVAVLERSASRPENLGDVIFTAIAEHQNNRFLIGTGCYLFADHGLNMLADFRYSVEEPWSDEDIQAQQPEFLDLYWGLRDELFHPHDNFENEFEIPTHKGPLGPFTLLECDEQEEANDFSHTNVTQLHQQNNTDSQDNQNIHSIVGQIEMQYLNKWLNKKQPLLNNLTPKQAVGKSQLKASLIKLAAELEYSNPFHRKWLFNQLDLS